MPASSYRQQLSTSLAGLATVTNRTGRAPAREADGPLRPGEQGRIRVGEERTHIGQEERPEFAVDDPVVEAQAERGHLPGPDLALVDPGPLRHRTEREDSRHPQGQ